MNSPSFVCFVDQEYTIQWITRSGEILREDKLGYQSVISVAEGYCINGKCECHTVEEKRVRTPFPNKDFPPYCCNQCARRQTPWTTLSSAQSLRSGAKS